MAVKTITITENAYKILKSKRESFSDIIIKIGRRRPLDEFFGILSKSRAEKLEKAISENSIELKGGFKI